MTPQADLTEILQMAADNNLTPAQTADLIITEGWITIHLPIAGQIVTWAAGQAEEVINTGTYAETTQPAPGDGRALYDIERKQLLQQQPHEWMNQLATELGATNWNI
jgi:hypothetical protein